MNAYFTTSTEYAEYPEFARKLDQIDFTPVAQQLAQAGWTEPQIERGMQQYWQFLFLVYQYPTAGLVPDQETDLVLHAHLATEQYTQDCQILFGADMLHENGFGTRGEADRLSWLKQFNRTKALIQRHFNWASLDALIPARCVVQLAV